MDQPHIVLQSSHPIESSASIKSPSRQYILVTLKLPGNRVGIGSNDLDNPGHSDHFFAGPSGLASTQASDLHKQVASLNLDSKLVLIHYKPYKRPVGHLNYYLSS